MISIKDIEEETRKVFDLIFTIEDILKGNVIEMMSEARNIAIDNLKQKEKNKLCN